MITIMIPNWIRSSNIEGQVLPVSTLPRIELVNISEGITEKLGMEHNEFKIMTTFLRRNSSWVIFSAFLTVIYEYF